MHVLNVSRRSYVLMTAFLHKSHDADKGAVCACACVFTFVFPCVCVI